MIQKPAARGSAGRGFLDVIERAGNRLPDPAILFVWVLAITWLASAVLAPVEFTEQDPRTNQPIRVVSQLTGPAMVGFLTGMVKTFMDFPPLGTVLVILLATGVAEHSGLFAEAIRSLLRLTSRRLITPMVMFVAVLSHSAGDPGFAIVIPAGGAIFAVSGRHPLSGIAAAFAGAAGGFSASFLPSTLDPLLQGFTQQSARIIDPAAQVNPLCNWWFMSAAAVLLIAAGWWITDRVIEPRLTGVPYESEPDSPGQLATSAATSRGLRAAALAAMAVFAVLLFACVPAGSPLRSPTGHLITPDAPLMRMIVPALFFLLLIPGIAYGRAAGSITSHRDVVQAMTKGMSSVSYYVVMAFFAAQFTAAFTQSNIGLLIAIKGANALKAWQLPAQLTIGGVIVLTAAINLLIGSASAKWALLSPIFVPMLMAVGLAPELTQAAFRVGDSSTNIITPLMPFFPLVVLYARRYVKEAGAGTLISLMLPYSMAFLLSWSLLLAVFWTLRIPLGLQAAYTYSR
ncbi:MAG: AbgT family transporter [Alphaproteobacteria bacterium]|nr:AbgT family transporter [Alphaproteobacteria bacterium]